VVAMVLRGLISYCRGGHCGLFGKGGLIMFDLSSRQATYTATDLAAVMLLGILGGLLGALFNYFVDRILRVYSLLNE
jgi:chloride channel 7